MWHSSVLLSKIPNNSLKLACFVIRFLVTLSSSLLPLIFFSFRITWLWEGHESWVLQDGMPPLSCLQGVREFREVSLVHSATGWYLLPTTCLLTFITCYDIILWGLVSACWDATSVEAEGKWEKVYDDDGDKRERIKKSTKKVVE